jgi:hypothetical protein
MFCHTKMFTLKVKMLQLKQCYDCIYDCVLNLYDQICCIMMSNVLKYSWLSVTRISRDWAIYFERNGIRVTWICGYYVHVHTSVWLNFQSSRFVIVDKDNAATFNCCYEGLSLTTTNSKWTEYIIYNSRHVYK